MTNEQQVRAAFANQVQYCVANDAPITGRICEAIIAVLDESFVFGRRVLEWHGNPLADALPLRAAAGFHALHLTGDEPSLAPLYAGEATAMAAAERLIGGALQRHEAKLLVWLDRPPQTNEAGRSANFAAAMLWLADKGLGSRFELNEIGSSAGINLMMDRYCYDLGGVQVGPDRGVLQFRPEWRGPSPPSAKVSIASAYGCDVAPVDLTNEAHTLRLKAYIWPEHTVRFARLEAAIVAARESAPHVERMDAANFVEARLIEPQMMGTIRVLMHSIVWQYLPDHIQQRITAMMEAAGAKATAQHPLAWMMVEADRSNFRHELRVKYWPGGGEEWTLLGTSHAHGAWIDWQGI